MEVSFVVASKRAEPSNIERIAKMLPEEAELVVSTVPGGAAHARNVGAKRARGSVLVFVDDDIHLSAQWEWEEWLARDWDYAIAEWYSPGPKARGFWMHLAAGSLNVLTRIFRYPLTMSGFTAIRREVFEAVGGYRLDTTYEEPALTLTLRSRGFRGAMLPVRVTVLERWDSFHRFNDSTSREKPHPEPGPDDVRVFRSPWNVPTFADMGLSGSQIRD
jgi:glycosyltransferase involved in cell wall biosynthesis